MVKKESEWIGIMNKPTRIRFNRFEGKPLPPRTILATRPGRWGNPFRWTEPKGVSEQQAKYLSKEDFFDWLVNGEYQNLEPERRQWILSHLRLIREAEHVACTCKLDEACHVDVLIELAMAEAGNEN